MNKLCVIVLFLCMLGTPALRRTPPPKAVTKKASGSTPSEPKLFFADVGKNGDAVFYLYQGNEFCDRSSAVAACRIVSGLTAGQTAQENVCYPVSCKYKSGSWDQNVWPLSSALFTDAGSVKFRCGTNGFEVLTSGAVWVDSFQTSDCSCAPLQQGRSLWENLQDQDSCLNIPVPSPTTYSSVSINFNWWADASTCIVGETVTETPIAQWWSTSQSSTCTTKAQMTVHLGGYCSSPPALYAEINDQLTGTLPSVSGSTDLAVAENVCYSLSLQDTPAYSTIVTDWSMSGNQNPFVSSPGEAWSPSCNNFATCGVWNSASSMQFTCGCVGSSAATFFKLYLASDCTGTHVERPIHIGYQNTLACSSGPDTTATYGYDFSAISLGKNFNYPVCSNECVVSSVEGEH